MNEYQIEFTTRARREIRNLPSHVQTRLRTKIDALAEEPRPSGVRKIRGADDLYRIRVGDYRVVYQVKDDVLVVLIIRVRHRRDVYR